MILNQINLVFKRHFWGDTMGLFNKIKNAFSKQEDFPEERTMRRVSVPVMARTEQSQDADHRKNIEESLTQMYRDFSAKRVTLPTLLDALYDLEGKIKAADPIAKSKQLPSSLYGVFTSTNEIKIQRAIAEIMRALSLQGNSDAIRIAKMLNQLVNDHVTKDVLTKAINRE